MPLSRQVKLPAAALAFAALLAAPALAQESGEAACERILLKGVSKPGWTISGAWETPEELVLVDALNNALLRYSPTGFLGLDGNALALKVATATGRFHPTRIAAPDPATTWLELTGGELVKVGGAAQPETLNLLRLKAPGERPIGSVFDWTMAGDDLVGFGNVRETSGEWTTAFYRVGLAAPHKVEILRELGRRPPEKAWYRLGLDLMTSLDGTAYLMRLGKRIALYKAQPGGAGLEHVVRFSGVFRNPPALPDFMTPEEFIRTMQTIEEASVPVGIYGFEKSLYIVWRLEDSETGAQRWYISEFNPRTRKIVRTLRLPTTANHLTVVPGERYWAFVEKGPVGGFGIQDVAAIRTVPASAILSARHGASLCE